MVERGMADRPQVVIVGAGPGDPELLTLKAVRELQAADVILYDRLVPDAVLELARRETRRYAKRQGTWFRNQAPGWPRVDGDPDARVAAALRVFGVTP